MAPISLQMHPFPAGRYGKHPIMSRAPSQARHLQRASWWRQAAFMSGRRRVRVEWIRMWEIEEEKRSENHRRRARRQRNLSGAR